MNIHTVILFSQYQFQLVQLDVTTKHLIQSASVAIPKGIIQRGQLLDQNLANQYLQSLLGKAKTAFKTVTLVIPEDIIISKSIALPLIVKKDISQAIKWEAEDFLPYDFSEAILDWKILDVDETVHVLFQSVQRKVLQPYLNICDQNNLSISVIESPAVALVKLSQKNSGTRFLIYISNSGAVLVLVRDQGIIGTSVVPFSNNLKSDLKKTVVHMQQYYYQFAVEWIQIGGTGLDSDILKEIQSLGLPVGGFYSPFPSVSTLIFNQYCLSLSAILTPLLGPKSEEIINLLPPEYVLKQQKQLFFYWLNRLLFFTTLYSLLILGSCLAVYIWLIRQQTLLNNSLSEISVGQKVALQQVSLANTFAKSIISVASVDFFPKEISSDIQKLAEDKVSLLNINIKIIDKTCELVGTAKDRSSLLVFKKSLEELPYIQTVYLPISSFSEEEKIPFQLKCSFKKELFTKDISIQ